MWFLLWGWIVKFVSGFLPFGGERIGKLLWVGLIALLVTFCFNFFQKPENVYKGPVTQNITEAPKAKYSSFGCTAGHVRTVLQWNW